MANTAAISNIQDVSEAAPFLRSDFPGDSPFFTVSRGGIIATSTAIARAVFHFPRVNATSLRCAVEIQLTLRSLSRPTDISKAAEDGAATAESDEKEKAAATKIQAVFRGHCARKSLKQPSKTASETEEDQKESPSDDKGERARARLCIAAD